MNQFERVLVLAPHADDGEIGCGGTIARLAEERKEIYYVAFCTARTSVRPEFPNNVLEIEVKAAIQVLGIPLKNLIMLDFPGRRFPECRQEILQQLIDLGRQIGPDLILSPTLYDTHQDHQVVAAEGLRAFKNRTLLGYEQPWNSITFETRCFISLEEGHVEKKIEALKCYKSQSHRSYLNEAFVRGLARTRGTQIEERYAEAFEVIRWVMR